MNNQASSNRLPTTVEVITAALEVLKDKHALTVQELEQFVIARLRLQPELLAIKHARGTPDKRSEFQYRLAWARTYLKKAGVATNPRRNYWKLLKAPAEGHIDGGAIVRKAARMYAGRQPKTRY